jgi:hypothetical protein
MRTAFGQLKIGRSSKRKFRPNHFKTIDHKAPFLRIDTGGKRSAIDDDGFLSLSLGPEKASLQSARFNAP